MGVPTREPRACDRGGDLVSTPRTTRPARLATAAVALSLAAGLGVATAFDAEPRAALWAGAALATVLLAHALVSGRSAPIPFALLLLGAIYAIPDGDRAVPVPVYGSVLLVATELAYWSLDERVSQRPQAGAGTPRLLAILALAAAAIPASALVLIAAEADVTRSPAVTAAGAAAIVACVGLLAALTARTR